MRWNWNSRSFLFHYLFWQCKNLSILLVKSSCFLMFHRCQLIIHFFKGKHLFQVTIIFNIFSLFDFTAPQYFLMVLFWQYDIESIRKRNFHFFQLDSIVFVDSLSTLLIWYKKGKLLILEENACIDYIKSKIYGGRVMK